MLLDFVGLMQKHKIELTGALVVGAHFAEEHEAFKSLGISKFIYVEPCENAFNFLTNRFYSDPEVQMFQFAAGSKLGKSEMYTETANNGQSNSLLKPKQHLIEHPSITFDNRETVYIIPLNSLLDVSEGCNLLYMDCQGFELEVLKGANKILPDVDVIYTEVNRGEVYEGCAQVEEIDKFLWDLGFMSIAEYWVPNGTWGDKVYVRPVKEFFKAIL